MRTKRYAQVGPSGQIVSTAVTDISVEMPSHDPVSGNRYVEIPDHVPLDMDMRSWWVGTGDVFAYVGMPPGATYLYDMTTEQWLDTRTIDDLRAEKWAEIKANRDAAEFGSFAWGGSVFDSDQISQSRIQGAALEAVIAGMADQPFTKDWTTADNTVRVLNGDEMIAVGMALSAHINACHGTARALRASILSAQTIEELETIQWPAA